MNLDGIEILRKLHKIWEINSEKLQSALSYAVIMIPAPTNEVVITTLRCQTLQNKSNHQHRT